jgi:hypothetical protein
LGRAGSEAGRPVLFNVDCHEAQFATTSRLRNEAAEVTELHFTPGPRRSVQLGAEYRF